MSKITTGITLLLLSNSILGADERISVPDSQESVKDRSVQHRLEGGIKNDYWNPGLHQNVLNYETEGLFLKYAKYKFRLDQTDIFSLEYYESVNNSRKQKELLQEFKGDQERTSVVDGFYISLHTLKFIDSLFDVNFFRHVNFQFEKRNFIGDGTLTSNAAFWTGGKEGQYNEAYTIVHPGDILSFKTKFDSYKVLYTQEKFMNDFYGSVGAFKMTWSKPTFLNEYLDDFNRIPLTYDAKYESTGISLNMGRKWKEANIKAFVDYGLDNKMAVASDVSLDGDIQVIIAGAELSFDSWNLYTSKNLAVDVTAGANAQWTKVGQEYGDIELDGEFNYGFKANLSVTF